MTGGQPDEALGYAVGGAIGGGAIGGEACLRIPALPGATTGPAILLVPPLFDEMNRLRRTLVLTMRALSDLGHHALLPDLPGQNDSLIDGADASLTLWRAHLAQVAASIDAPFVIASWRGGALIDDAVSGAVGWWRMAPCAGAPLLRTLLRARAAGQRAAGHGGDLAALAATARTTGIDAAGYAISPLMAEELEFAVPAATAPLRSVAVGDGPDAVPGSTLWLRAEPGEDAAMARAMAADISAWSRTCAVP